MPPPGILLTAFHLPFGETKFISLLDPPAQYHRLGDLSHRNLFSCISRRLEV